MIRIAGTIRIAPERLDAALPAMETVVRESRAEDGCLEYAYALDLFEPGLVRISEAWRDQEALSAHAAAPHIADWRSAWPELGISDRRLTVYEIAASRDL